MKMILWWKLVWRSVWVRGSANRVVGAGGRDNHLGDENHYHYHGPGASAAGYPAGMSVDRDTALASMGRLSRGRLIARWMAAGLEEEAATVLAEDRAVGLGPAALGPLPARGLVVLEGDFGSGKSVTAERLHQADMAVAAQDLQAPVPVYLDARLVDGSLADAVWRETGPVADLSVVGVHLVLDGLDGVPVDRALELLGQARSLIQRRPLSSRVVATARPGLPDIADNERVHYPPLKGEEADALARRVSGRHIAVPAGSGQVQDALLLPLFVIIAALLQGEGRAVPSSRIDFLNELVERALRRTGAGHVRAAAALTRLARLTIEAGGPVAAAEAGNQENIRALLATRLVLRRGHTLAFGLPVLEQYFGGQSVLEAGLPQGALNRAGELDRWRYPLALALAACSWEQASSLLQSIIPRHPGLAAWLLHEAIPGQGRGSLAATPSADVAGERVQAALTVWLPAFSPVSSELKIATGGDAPPTILGAHTDGGKLVTAARPTAAPGEEVGVRMLDRADLASLCGFCGPNGSSHRGYPAVDYPAWPWRWSLDWMSERLTPLLQNGELHAGLGGPALEERRWQLCRAASGEDGPLPWPLEAATVVDGLRHATAPANMASCRFTNGLEASGAELLGLLTDLEAGRGIEPDGRIHCPFPGPDVASSRWVYGHYSDQRLADLASYTHGSALQIYRELCERCFPQWIPALGLASILPVHISGHVTRNDHDGFLSHEYGYHMSPVSVGMPSTATFAYQAAAASHMDWPSLMEVGAGIRRTIKQLHPESGPWARPRAALAAFGAPCDTPATRVAYQWLWEDLRSLRIVSGSAPR